MPKAARLGDIGSGHGCFPDTKIKTASGDVKIDGLPAVRIDDQLGSHDCAVCTSHERTVAAGSGSVTINGKAVARVGDAIDCGGVIISGSETVNIGD